MLRSALPAVPRASRAAVPWPDLLSGFRLVAAPLLLLLAWQGRATAFGVVLLLAFASDALDGFLARRLGLASPRGARLDSLGDLAFWSVIPFAVAWLRPDLLVAAAPEVAVLVGCLVVPTVVGLVRFRRFTSYHTWGAKLTAVGLSATLLALFAGAPPWLLRPIAAVAALSALEELAITALLPRWRSDVPSVVHAWRLRDAERDAGAHDAKRDAKGGAADATRDVPGDAKNGASGW